MAKHDRTKKRGRRSGVRPGNVEQSLGLGTLAANDLLGANLTGTVDKPEFLVSAFLAWSLRDLTLGQGPVIVGLAHSDYLDAEIEEYVENTGGWASSDKVAQEIVRRQIRIVGKFSGNDTEESLNDGKPIRTPLMMSVTAGQGLKMWAYNSGSGAFSTTAPVLELDGVVWIRT